ncbi:MAG TPA: glucose 1-dehydrogenase [Solirubrobacteraceae bacterium]
MAEQATRVIAPDVSDRSLADLVRLDGRGAVVTGAARGLGRAIAMRLAELGAGVLVADLDHAAAAQTAADLPFEAGRAIALDVRDPDAMAAAADEAAATFGSLDVWVNNAGIFPPAHPLRAPKELFEQILSVNVTGTQLGAQAAAAHMQRAGRGVIVNIASTAAYRGAGAYSASKWAVRGLTSGLAAQLGPSGIRVVGVAPSLVATPGTGAVREGGGERMADVFSALVDSLPLGREGQPDDIARVVAFLAGDAAAFITGVTLPVDGGELTQ